MRRIGMFDPETLYGAQIISVTQFVEEFFLNRPVAVSAFSSEFPLDVMLKVVLDAVVIE